MLPDMHGIRWVNQRQRSVDVAAFQHYCATQIRLCIILPRLFFVRRIFTIPPNHHLVDVMHFFFSFLYCASLLMNELILMLLERCMFWVSSWIPLKRKNVHPINSRSNYRMPRLWMPTNVPVSGCFPGCTPSVSSWFLPTSSFAHARTQDKAP